MAGESAQSTTRPRWWRMPLASAAVGIAGGLAGVGVALLLRLVQHIAFGYSSGSFLDGVEVASPGRRVGALAIGGLIAGLGWWWLRRHGTPEDVSVTHALREPDSRFPVLATTADGVLQVIAVGAGASLGREGAPRQIGATLAGWISAKVQVSTAQRRTLIACGAGAGLAAVYNVPVGGAAFTLEVLLVTVGWRELVPAILTSAIATVVSWPVLSTRPTYEVSGLHLTPALLVWALLAGPLCGLLGVGFHRLTTFTRTHALSGPRAVLSIVLTFTALGLLAAAFPQLLGNGKGPAQLALIGSMTIGLAAILTILKPLAAAACLGAGAVGGLLTPALATGAVFGVFLGGSWNILWPGTPIGDYALVGAAAVLAVTQRAPITAVVLVTELVRPGPSLIAPMVVAVALAELVVWLVARDLLPWPGRERPPCK